MAWIAVDKDGAEFIFSNKPSRGNICWHKTNPNDSFIRVPNGTSRKLTGKELTFYIEPLELK